MVQFRKLDTENQLSVVDRNLDQDSWQESICHSDPVTDTGTDSVRHQESVNTYTIIKSIACRVGFRGRRLTRVQRMRPVSLSKLPKVVKVIIMSYGQHLFAVDHRLFIRFVSRVVDAMHGQQRCKMQLAKMLFRGQKSFQ